MRQATVLALLCVAAITPAPVAACGAASDCPVAGGVYRIRLPSRPTSGLIGAVVFFHGWRSSAAEAMADEALAAAADGLGAALVAPNGEGGRWSLPSSARPGRDEFAFVDAVLDDVLARFPVDRTRVMATGFSLGGSMVWYLACRKPGRFMSFAPVAGSFWSPAPQSCVSSDIRLFHLHGRADETVPLAGRRVSSGAQQGDTFASFATLCGPGEEASYRRDVHDVALACRAFAGCRAPGKAELCLHESGHAFDAAWVGYAWRQTLSLIGAPQR